MALIATMLKKFNYFFHQPEIDLSFPSYALRMNDQTFQVMKASDENISDLLVLEEQFYSGKTPWNKFSFESELKKHANSIYLVVYKESTLVAFVGMRIQAQEGHITNIAVKPTYQHQGIGTYLLKLMIELAKRNHAVQMTLEVRVDNSIAKKLYQSLGFKANFIRKNYYASEQMDALNMIKKFTSDIKEEALN